jgi:hypothetical protein
MKPLEEMHIGHRVIVTILIVIAILLALLLLGSWMGRREGEGASAQTPDIEIYSGVPLDRKFLELDKRALDEAYHQQLLLLFSVWLKGGDADAARRFGTGMNIARRSYSQAAREINRREQLSDEQQRR